MIRPQEDPEGATPLDADERAGLIATHVSTRGELNALEQANIVSARAWILNQKRGDPLSDLFMKKVHQRMFRDVWRWAGEYRTTAKNIGVPPHEIAVEMRRFCENARTWIEKQAYPWDELAARYHHRLVWIHAFPNGNGRHARLMTDLLMSRNGQPDLTWGAMISGDPRDEYLSALREADERRFGKLTAFLRR